MLVWPAPQMPTKAWLWLRCAGAVWGTCSHHPGTEENGQEGWPAGTLWVLWILVNPSALLRDFSKLLGLIQMTGTLGFCWKGLSEVDGTPASQEVLSRWVGPATAHLSFEKTPMVAVPPCAFIFNWLPAQPLRVPQHRLWSGTVRLSADRHPAAATSRSHGLFWRLALIPSTLVPLSLQYRSRFQPVIVGWPPGDPGLV